MSSIAFDTVERFEKEIAKYSGAKYGVAIDSCSNAIFLCCKYLGVKGVYLVKHTYPGVVCAIKNAGGSILEWLDNDWKGRYEIMPYDIIDSALRFKKGMYLKGTYYCVSFHIKKHIPIGRGGMILTDDLAAVKWFKKARFDGRSQCPLEKDKLTMTGWNCYMTPEQAARGLTLFELIKDKNLPDLDTKAQNYPDLSKVEAYK